MRLFSKIVFTWTILLIILAFAVVSCNNDGDDDDNGPSAGTQPEPVGDAAALFGYDVDDARFFITHMTPSWGEEINIGNFTKGHKWQPMAYITVEDNQFIMGHGVKNDEGRYEYFIQEILETGDLGHVTDNGSWYYKYDTLIPLNYGNITYIFAQNSDNNWFFIQEITSDGVLADDEADNGYGEFFYPTITQIPLEDTTCFFAHTVDPGSHYWVVDCISSEGKLFREDSGNFDNGYQVATSYTTEEGQTYLFGHRKWTDWDDVFPQEKGKWFISSMHHNGAYNESISEGTWNNFYPTINVFEDPGTDILYLVGQDDDRRFFIQHVTYEGTMGYEIYAKVLTHFYDYLFPIMIDSDYYHTSNWMGTMNGLIGDRMLYQIAIQGSHDAGMNGNDWGDCYPSGSARECNTVTQRGDIAFQLDMGSRYFDIRPVLDADSDGTDDWRTGHTTDKDGELFGCKGESRNSIVDAVNKFFDDSDNHREIVILKISHCVKRVEGLAIDCTSDELASLSEDFVGRFDDFLVLKGDDNTKPMEMTVNEILDKGANVIVVVSSENIKGFDYIPVNNRPEIGAFKYGSSSDGRFYAYDDFSNSNDFNTMRDDQLNKLEDTYNHFNGDDRIPFLLSWTLTLSTNNALDCTSTDKNGIIAYSYLAQWRLVISLMDWVADKHINQVIFPNILYTDDFNGTATRAAMYLNQQYENLDIGPVQSGTQSGN